MSLDALANGTKKTPSPTPEVKGISLMPYTARADKTAPEFLPWLWKKLQDDGLVELYFPGQAELGFADFCSVMSNVGNKVIIVWATDDTGKATGCVGFATWQPLPLGAALAASAGFVFFREFWDRHTSDDAAKAIQRYWWEVEGLDVVIGVIAQPNHLAQRFMARLGWTKLGDIPLLHLYKGKQCPASFWYTVKPEAKEKA